MKKLKVYLVFLILHVSVAFNIQHSLGGAIYPNSALHLKLSNGDEVGKFQKIGSSSIPKEFGTRAIITAKWSEESLTILDDLLEVTVSEPLPPVVILSKNDEELVLENVLSVNFLVDRDHELPGNIYCPSIVLIGYLSLLTYQFSLR